MSHRQYAKSNVRVTVETHELLCRLKAAMAQTEGGFVSYDNIVRRGLLAFVQSNPEVAGALEDEHACQN